MRGRGFVDLHSHWVSGIDDGPRDPGDGIALLRALHDVGFSTVVATPHMRPGMFDNDRAALTAAYGAMCAHRDDTGGAFPETHLASEHFFDDVVFTRLVEGEGLPYPGGGAVLVEFPSLAFPTFIQARFFDLSRRGLTLVLAHPERYRPVWDDDGCLDPLLDAGAHLLLDLGSLVGRYGRAAERAATKLLEDGAYEAACSDAHRPEDAEWVARAIGRLGLLVGDEEAYRLLADGPRGILLRANRHAPQRPRHGSGAT